MRPRSFTTSSIIQDNLEKTYSHSPELTIGRDDRFIILSDFHIGSGKSRDEFRRNADLVIRALRDWYLPEGYILILNGDIEELHRVSLRSISQRWTELYELFLEFKKGPGLYKIIGNHDHGISHNWRSGRSAAELDVNAEILPSLKLLYGEKELLILHGHQASLYNSPFRHRVNKAALRYVAHPLHINNIKRHYLSSKPLKAEQRLFDFARSRSIVAVAGHTHRALFEGHSEEEYLKFRLDQMIRDYMNMNGSEEKKDLHEAIRETGDLLQNVLENEDYKSHGSIYDPLSLPCLFNSGTVIHKFGTTGLEIENGTIALTAWYDVRNPRSRIFHYEKSISPFPALPGIRKAMLKSDSLDYIFTRIELLT